MLGLVEEALSRLGSSSGRCLAVRPGISPWELVKSVKMDHDYMFQDTYKDVPRAMTGRGNAPCPESSACRGQKQPDRCILLPGCRQGFLGASIPWP